MLSMKDAIIERCLEGVAQGDFDLHGVADVKDLFDKLRNYRAQLPVLHPLKKNAVAGRASRGGLEELDPRRPTLPGLRSLRELDL